MCVYAGFLGKPGRFTSPEISTIQLPPSPACRPDVFWMCLLCQIYLFLLSDLASALTTALPHCGQALNTGQHRGQQAEQGCARLPLFAPISLLGLLARPSLREHAVSRPSPVQALEPSVSRVV